MPTKACFTGETLVAAQDKTGKTKEKPIKDIKLGDFVLTDIKKSPDKEEHSKKRGEEASKKERDVPPFHQ